MINKRTRDSFDRFFTQAIKASLVASSDGPCEVTVLNDPADIKENRIVMLTVSSYLFRLMVLIYVTPDSNTKEHFARISKVQASTMSEQDFYDAVAECGNMCCGILNRDLGAFFPHIGMSTPNIIDRDCASYLNMLDCGHIQHFRVKAANTSALHVGLCVRDYADLDFVASEKEEDISTGELELF